MALLPRHSPSRQICNVDKGVVEAGIDVSYSEHILSLSHLRSECNLLLGLRCSLTLGSHIELPMSIYKNIA